MVPADRSDTGLAEDFVLTGECEGLEDTVLREVRENEDLHPPELITRLRRSTECSDELLREVLWQLLGTRRLILTEDRRLRVAS